MISCRMNCCFYSSVSKNFAFGEFQRKLCEVEKNQVLLTHHEFILAHKFWHVRKKSLKITSIENMCVWKWAKAPAHEHIMSF